MQQDVLDVLSKQPDWTPISREVVEGIRTQLHNGLADIADKLDPQRALWVSKHKLTTVHGCEAHHMAGLPTSHGLSTMSRAQCCTKQSSWVSIGKVL